MPQVTFRFYDRLNFFLSKDRREVAFVHSFEATPSIKDMIEALGVPHTEVDHILVNGNHVDFSYLVQAEDQIQVYPLDHQLDGLVKWPKPNTDETRFVLDIHLGRLAANLRMLGFDSLYSNTYDDPELARISSSEGRILLTRDLGLLKRSIVTYGYYVRDTKPRRQVIEVLRRFDLLNAIRPFHRCLACNGLIQPIEKERILDRLEARTREFFDEFYVCQRCDKIYWKGSHFDQMTALVEEIRRLG